MNWFYSEGGRQNGPVSDSQLDELLQAGTISLTTLVWHEGMKEWQPLGAVRAGAAVCVECGKTFPPEETIKLNDAIVCAGCKPIFLQRLAESATLPSGAGLWRTGKRMVCRPGTVFPDRCVKCNAPANGFRLKRTLSWAHPAYLLLLLCNIIILLVVYLIVRKKAVVHIGLCSRHCLALKNKLLIAWIGVMVAFILLIYGTVAQSGLGILFGVLTLLGSCVVGFLTRTVTATKINKEYVWMTGAHRDFMADLPEWRG